MSLQSYIKIAVLSPNVGPVIALFRSLLLTVSLNLQTQGEATGQGGEAGGPGRLGRRDATVVQQHHHRQKQGHKRKLGENKIFGDGEK